MITRIEIDGFKSFENFALDVPPFLVLIGTNASGKSNLLDALTFLSTAATEDLDAAVDLGRGDARGLFRRRGDGSVVDSMWFALEMSDVREGFHTRARYEVEFAWGIRADLLDGIVVRSQRIASGFGRSDQEPELGDWFPVTPGTHNLLGSPDDLPDEDNDRVGFLLIGRELSLIRALHLEAGALRQASRIGGGSALTPAGRHLPNYLLGMGRKTASPERPRGVLSEIAMHLAGLVREVTEFEVIVDEARRDVRIGFSSPYQDDLSAELASDGTLRILAMLAVLHDIGLAAVEEPENGVFPERLRQLLVIAQDLEGDRQVIFTSHAPVVLDAVPRENIAYFDMTTVIENGAPSRVTRARRLRDEGGPASVEGERWARVTDSELDRFRVGIEEPVG
ncbi:AAA family ATPase [Herbidospora mongoliensis]|uniref:AAA family ATPase n=1 Tax=Herbidospora mongoliensis TaxID=688067 RepID=UPI000836A205|nr:ATP-binding protein [Herbidospora mongoliensis]